MPKVLVGVLVLAVVTSLPNAYTGVRLGRSGRGSALVSETVNSNTINLVGGLAIPALFVTVSIRSGLERADGIWLLVLEQPEEIRLAHVQDDELGALRHRLATSMAQVVDHRDAVSTLEQGANGLCPDESRSSRHNHVHCLQP